MKKFENIQEAFASQNFDPSNLKIEGVPERHLKAVEAFAKLCIAHDAVNPEFDIDHSNTSQRKYENIFEVGSSSGVGFAYIVYADWRADSRVGSRLCSESSEASKHLSEIAFDEYKEMMVYKREIK